MSPTVAAGRVCILTAAVLWSTSGFFIKAPLFDVWPAAERGTLLAFWRALFAALALAPLVVAGSLLRRRDRAAGAPAARQRWDWRILPMVGCFALMSIAYMSAATYNTAANAIWLQSTAPLWVLLFNWVIRRTGVGRQDFGAIAFAAAGLGVILFYEFTHGSGAASPAESRWGVLCGLTAGACYGGVVMFLRALRRLDAVWLVLLNQLATAAVLAPWALAIDQRPSGVQLAALAAFGALQIGLPYWLFTYGLRSVASQEASLIGLLEPVLVPAWVFFVLGNHETQWWTLAGGGLIQLGLAWRYLPAAWAGANAGIVRSAQANTPNSSAE